MAEFVRDVIAALGYPGIAVLVAIENLFPPLPSELILPLAGWLVDRGEFSFLGAVLAATAGSVGGALILYGIARKGGRPTILRFERILRVDADDLDRLERGFARHGVLYVAGARLIPGLRSAVSVPAGLTRMPLGRFTVLTTIGSAAWNAALIGGGWVLGHEYERVADVVGPIGTVVLVLAVAGGAGWLLHRRRTRRDAPAG
jgi:membrane protein DedA with SNARE-associated domain